MTIRKSGDLLPTVLIGAALVGGALVMPALAQQGAAKPAAQVAYDTPASLEAFEYGLAAAQSGKYDLAVEFFVKAAKAGDTEWRTNTTYKRSRKPEVWFNLALAESKVPGFELHAIAAFKYYLLLSPNASNAEAIKQQVRTLEIAVIDEIRTAAGKIGPLIPTYPPDGKDSTRWTTSSMAGQDLAEIYLAIGDRARALDAMDRYIGGWRTESGTGIASRVASDTQTWGLLPQQQFPFSSSYRLEFELEGGDFDSALRLIERITPKAGQPQDWADTLEGWEAFACTAQHAGRADLVKMALDTVSKAPIGDPGDYRLWTLPALLFEFGRSEDARVVLTAARSSTEVEWIRKVVDGVDAPPGYKFCEMPWIASHSGDRWYGAARPMFLQTTAVYPEQLAKKMDEAKAIVAASEWDRSALAQATSVLSTIAQRARVFRQLHGPWPPN